MKRALTVVLIFSFLLFTSSPTLATSGGGGGGSEGSGMADGMSTDGGWTGVYSPEQTEGIMCDDGVVRTLKEARRRAIQQNEDYQRFIFKKSMRAGDQWQDAEDNASTISTIASIAGAIAGIFASGGAAVIGVAGDAIAEGGGKGMEAHLNGKSADEVFAEAAYSGAKKALVSHLGNKIKTGSSGMDAALGFGLGKAYDSLPNAVPNSTPPPPAGLAPPPDSSSFGAGGPQDLMDANQLW